MRHRLKPATNGVSSRTFFHCRMRGERRRRLTKLALGIIGFVLVTLYMYQPPSCDDHFFIPRREKQLSLEYNYIHEARNLCSFITNGSDEYTGPDVVIMVQTMSQKVKKRQAIRDTYGSVARGKSWPNTDQETEASGLGTVKVVFMMGETKDPLYTATESETVAKESRVYGDVVQWEGLVEDYSNLTLKVLLGLRWVRDVCPHARHVVKTDDDVFIHVPRLVRYIHVNSPQPLASSSQNANENPTQPDNGNIYGAWLGGAVVQRRGRYVSTEEEYPYRVYPLNVKGALYLMPTRLATRMLRIAEHVPYNSLEDVHVTGTLACMVGARHVGFTMTQLDYCNTNPQPCDFADGVRIASRDVTPQMSREIWHTFSQPDSCSGLFSRLLFTPEFLRFPKCLLLDR